MSNRTDPPTSQFDPQKADRELQRCLRADRFRLRRRLRRARDGQALAEVQSAIARSAALRAQRKANLPTPEFDANLPIVQQRARIEQAIRDHQVVVVCGETGSGKSTQLPKMCLAIGRGVDGFIGHTQPRRIAARSIAARIAAELNTPLGGAVGYKIRFTDQVSDRSLVKVMTDGILLAEVEGDRFLDRYDTLIIDEAHERSLNIDFLLGYLKRLLPKRRDLKLIITSATIDPTSFSRHFDDAPVIEVSGRTYPVEVRYRPFEIRDRERQDRTLQAQIVHAVDELSEHGPGDVLVFLPGERDIRNTAELLRKRRLPHTEILPLYARLSTSEQQRVFQSHRGRRIVLATNVAETSLTVPGIRYVIDTGNARISRYSPGRQVQRLPIEPISQAAADQRMGRCGRMEAGVCIRLYSQEDYESRPRYTEPEIVRTSLAAVILKLKGMGLGEIEDFPFLDAPSPRLVSDGYRLLEELTAIDSRRRLTELGRRLARLPVDPRIGRMLLAGDEHGALSELLTITAALSIVDPREYPEEQRERARQLHQRYDEPGSDFLSYLKLWNDFHDRTQGLNQRRVRNYCADNLLAYSRMREWVDVRDQLIELVRETHRPINATPASADAVHRALLAGLLGNIACHHERNEFIGTHGKRLHIHPSSGLFKGKPKWVMAAELVDTDRLYARTAAAIQPQWAEPLAGDLVRRSYLEPHWDAERGQVIAFEQVSLFGLIIVPRRPVHYGPIDPAQARAVFIREALVAGAYTTRAAFYAHNRDLIKRVEVLEHKSRRRDVLVDEEQQFRFYDARIPAGIATAKGFERWLRSIADESPDLLLMTEQDLMRHDAEFVTADRFPNSITVAGNTLRVRYHFAPGHPNDGVTVTVPAALLKQLPAEPFTWLVPGLLLEKITALIRSLPKPLRRHCVPAPDVAAKSLDLIAPGERPLTEALAEALRRMTGVAVQPDDWDPSKLPPHLFMNFEVVDEHGGYVGAGRDLRVLRDAHGSAAARAFTESVRTDVSRRGITRWDFGDLPSAIEHAQGATTIRAYPALVDAGDSVAIELFDTPDAAAVAMRVGLRRLTMLELAQQTTYLRKNLPGIERMCLNFTGVGRCEDLRQDLVHAVYDRLLFADGDTVRDHDSFVRRRELVRQNLIPTANDTCVLVDAILQEYRAIIGQVAGAGETDIREQLALLVYPGFVTNTPPQWLTQYPRYLKAVQIRLERLRTSPAKDAAKMAELAPHWQRLRQRANQLAAGAAPGPALLEYRWMIEEYRVSLFAQQLRTAIAVSPKRLSAQWQKVEAEQRTATH